MLTLLLLLAGGSASLWGQQAAKDSVFRMLEAERAEQYEHYGIHYRLVQGHARFFHNDTYLLCDSASWNVDAKFIEAFGHVQIIQNNTMLKSEEMLYWINESRALFRGGLVELFDKDGNTLRTERLTYNTKDSVAIFEFGGALKDKDGNVIESRNGTYDAKEGLFTFDGQVELYMDTVEIKTTQLKYFTDAQRAHFGDRTFVWRDEGFLRADAGWWDRNSHVISFSDHVFMFDPAYDAWADELYYYQQNGAVDLLRNAQVLDTTNQTIYLGDRLQYLPADSTHSQRGLLTGEPAIIYYGENENHVVDTLYARADTFYVYAVPKCDIPEEEVKEANKRTEDILYDTFAKKRAEEAEAREKERIQKMRDAGILPPEWVEKQKQAEADSIAALAAAADSLAALAAADSLAALLPPIDSLSALPDSLSAIPDSLLALPDSLSAFPDTVAVALPRDTTPIRYILGWHNVKMFRSDLQAACDSMAFCEIDSIARLFGEPVLWNEVRNQLTAEEMQLLMKDGSVQRGSMITDAWIISQQDSIHFNQIKSTEMLGYFRDNQLYRFDALGGVSAIFYMAEEETITTINVKESRMMTAAIKDGNAQRVLYMEDIKSDAYPVGDLELSKQRLKGFEWRGEERPVSREVITTREVRASERDRYEGMTRPLYPETNKYFDNYIFNLIDSLNAVRLARQEQRQRERDSIMRAEALQEMAAERDSALLDPSLDPGFDRPADTVAVAVAPADTLRPPVQPEVTEEKAVIPDAKPIVTNETNAIPTLTDHHEETAPASPETVVKSEQLTRAEKRALRRAERKARREARRAARLARRAERAARRR